MHILIYQSKMKLFLQIREIDYNFRINLSRSCVSVKNKKSSNDVIK